VRWKVRVSAAAFFEGLIDAKHSEVIIREIILTLCFAALIGTATNADTKKIFVVTWESECEYSCQGFIETIENSGFDAEVILRRANQDKSKFSGFIEEPRQVGADLIATYGTSVTLGILGRRSDDGDHRFVDGISGVFWYVADPFGTGIAENFEGSGRPHITGTVNGGVRTCHWGGANVGHLVRRLGA
jgi:hypothetical protein